MSIMPKSEREELRKLCDSATPGPWEYHPGDNVIVGNYTDGIFQWQPRSMSGDSRFIEEKERNNNGLLVAASRTAIPALITSLDEAERVIDLILPLAKGYAAEHSVGSNQEYVNEADRFIGRE